MAYKIAEYLTDEAKREAVNRYYRRSNGGGFPQAPRTVEGFCPLGVALSAMGAPSADPDPAANIVADRLLELGHDASRRQITARARGFIRAWDNGSITDLAAALGVAQ